MREKPSHIHNVKHAPGKGKNPVHFLEAAPSGFRKHVVDNRDHSRIESCKDDKVSLPHGVEREWRDISDKNADSPGDADAEAVYSRS